MKRLAIINNRVSGSAMASKYSIKYQITKNLGHKELRLIYDWPTYDLIKLDNALLCTLKGNELRMEEVSPEYLESIRLTVDTLLHFATDIHLTVNTTSSFIIEWVKKHFVYTPEIKTDSYDVF